jgi:hypothetical protein
MEPETTFQKVPSDVVVVMDDDDDGPEKILPESPLKRKRGRPRKQQGPPATAPARGKYRVALLGLTARVVEASSPEEAYELYRIASGLVASDHTPDIRRVD